jgi:tRNA(Arg) A34 adenosine deaminase TadA
MYGQAAVRCGPARSNGPETSTEEGEPITSPAATGTDRYWMGVACDIAKLCPHTEIAYAVGAVIVGEDGQEIARGYSRETGPHVHAEESALRKIGTAR